MNTVKMKQKFVNKFVESALGRKLICCIYNLKNTGIKQRMTEQPVITVLEYCQKRDLPINYIEEGESCYTVGLFEGKNGTGTQQVYIDRYPIYTAELSDVVVCGNSEGIVTEEYVLNDTIAYKEEIPFCLGASYLFGIDQERRHALTLVQPNIRTIVTGLCLVGRGTDHWWHLHYELLPLLYIFDKNTFYQNLPIIISEGILNNQSYKELVDCVNIHHPIVYIKHGECVRVKKLIYASFPTMEINGTWAQKVFGYIESMNPLYLYYEPSIKFIRDSVLKRVEVGGGKRRIFLRRNHSRLMNEQEVSEYLSTKGFEIIYSDEMTFQEEIKAFAEAEYLISSWGGQMSNLLYCSRGATVVCAVPKFVMGVLGHQQLADMLGFRYCIQDVRLCESDDENNRMCYKIDINALKALCNDLGI